MKKWMCLFICLMLMPTCAMAEKAFPTTADSFQWHLSDMLEMYIAWDSMGNVQGKTEMLGYAPDGGSADFIIRTDASGKLYRVTVSAILDPDSNMYTMEGMNAVLDGAQAAAHTLALLTNGKIDIEDPFLMGEVHSMHRDVSASRRLTPSRRVFTAPGIQCVQELTLATSQRMMYQIRFEAR